jgi:hypothetical protein
MSPVEPVAPVPPLVLALALGAGVDADDGGEVRPEATPTPGFVSGCSDGLRASGDAAVDDAEATEGLERCVALDVSFLRSEPAHPTTAIVVSAAATATARPVRLSMIDAPIWRGGRFGPHVAAAILVPHCRKTTTTR